MNKIRRRLSPEEAKFLGFTPKKMKGFGNASYYITQGQLDQVVREFRTQKAEVSRGHVYNNNTSKSSPNDYGQKKLILSALDAEGKMMNIDAYCKHYGLPRDEVSSYKLVSHTGIPFYNIVFREKAEDGADAELIREILSKHIQKEYRYTVSSYKNEREGVLKISDLHFGAYIRNLVLGQDYDDSILLNYMMTAVEELNWMNFKTAHVHINGDLIESFSGLNHVNSWMSMDIRKIGAQAVILCTNLLHKVLSQVSNLGEIKIVAGNHDRTSKANDEDVKGGAAELIAWGLNLMGYSVEFHPMIITHKVEGINHINLHGHFGISRSSTEKILWKYGKKGCFNYISEGHLHSIIQKLSDSQRQSFLIVKDDSIDHRRSHLAPMFTGNYYSETLGHHTNAGFEIVFDNGKGKPKVLQSTIG